MKVYRISNPLYIQDKSGYGAKLKGYRWNHAGTPLLYTAGTTALAAWEVRVHLPNIISPRIDAYSVIDFEIPDDLIIDLSLIYPDPLPSNWKEDDILTKGIGTDWVLSLEHLCLKVPSAIIDSEFNFLINPLHSEIGQVLPGSPRPFTFDARTFASIS